MVTILSQCMRVFLYFPLLLAFLIFFETMIHACVFTLYFVVDDQGGAVAQGISSKANHSSSQNNMTVNSSDNLSCETNSSTRQSDKGSSRKRGRRCQHLDGTGKDSLVDVVLHECDGACGPRTSSPDRGQCHQQKK